MLSRDKAAGQFKKKNNESGKMFVNELWGKKLYFEILHRSNLWNQNHNILLNEIKTTEDKGESLEKLYYQKMSPIKERTIMGLFERHINDNMIKQEDVTVNSDSDRIWDELTINKQKPKPPAKKRFQTEQKLKTSRTLLDFEKKHPAVAYLNSFRVLNSKSRFVEELSPT